MKKNPFEKFRMKGVRGTVPSGFDSKKIYDRAGESIVIYLGRLDDSAWDFGYDMVLKDGTHLKRLPGVGSGWFEKIENACGYALNALLIAYSSRMTEGAVNSLKSEISSLMMPKLDLL